MAQPEIRYVICRTTGTILDLNDCYIVTDEQLAGAFTDSDVCHVADSFGVSVERLFEEQEN